MRYDRAATPFVVTSTVPLSYLLAVSGHPKYGYIIVRNVVVTRYFISFLLREGPRAGTPGTLYYTADIVPVDEMYSILILVAYNITYYNILYSIIILSTGTRGI